MPSSLVFAALAVAWIVVLVPMVARRRQEVRRTADSALAARVLHRGDGQDRPEEVPDMPDEHYETQDDYEPDDRPAERRYRPGRGGFDPYAAELAARAKYTYRQRVVLALLLLALATGLLAGFALPMLWWAHAGIDLTLVGYLGYLRRQVRIEQEIRQRRIDRATRGRRAIAAREDDHDDSYEADDEYDSYEPEPEPAEVEPAPAPRARPRPVHPGAAIVDLDDEDPALCELDPESPAPYRRAAGE